MMKKMIILSALVAFSLSVIAAENATEQRQVFRPARQEQPGVPPDMQDSPEGCPFAQAPAGPRQGFSKEQMKENRQKMKAAQEKRKADSEQLEKLVKEYKKAKEGSKKQVAAKEQIAQKLGEMREEQIQDRREKLNGFEQRLTDMKNRLTEEEKQETKDAWVQDMTDRVIENDGKLNAVFKQGPKGADFGGPEGAQFGKGHKIPGGQFKGHKGGHEDHTLPMPPAPEEEK